MIQVYVKSLGFENLKIKSSDLLSSIIDRNFNSINDYCKFSFDLLGLKKSFRDYVTIDGIDYFLEFNHVDQCFYLFSQKLHVELLLSENSGLSEELQSIVLKLQSRELVNDYSEIDLITKKFSLANINQDAFYEKNVDLLNQKEILKKKLKSKISEYKMSYFEKFSDFFLLLTSRYDLVRIHFLKFLALLPCLDHDKSGKEVKRNFLETLRRFTEDNKKARKGEFKTKGIAFFNIAVEFFLNFTRLSLEVFPAWPLAALLRTATRTMAKRFIAGEEINSSRKTLLEIDQTDRSVTLDQLGELVLTDTEADHYCEKVIDIIEGLKEIYPNGAKNKASILKAHVSIKVSALASNFIPEDHNYCFDQIAPRLKRIFDAARKNCVFVNIDAEHFHYRDRIWKIYSQVLLDYPQWMDTGIVVQCYLKSGAEHFLDIEKFCVTNKRFMPVRLVKGAYWDAETVEARAHSDFAPQFLNKVESDIHFQQLICKTLESSSLQLCLASHNIEDHSFAQSYRDLLISKFSKKVPAIEHQCLHMTYEGLSCALAKSGFVVRNYVPIGDLLIGMAYLVRRIMENSSQVGVLAISRSHLDEKTFTPNSQILKDLLKSGCYVWEDNKESLSSRFFNQPPLKTYLKNKRVFLDQGFESFQKALPLRFSENGTKIFSPNDLSLEVGRIACYDTEETNKVIDGLSYWNETYQKKLLVMAKVLTQIRQKRNELTSLIVLESGKNFHESLADVDEAIDFIFFYLSEQGHIDQTYKPLGIVGVIAPWNFPLAIPIGMTVGALVAGNAVVLKSSEQTPLISEVFVRIFHECGVPESVLRHTPGPGRLVGEAISRHPKISEVIFTGSKKIGLSIYEKINRKLFDSAGNQLRCITEMGGKNAIIVTNSCELDETISGVLYAAFAHAGQKCSAASRVLVHKSVKKDFNDRLKLATQALVCGRSDQWSTLINPLIRKEDVLRIRELRKKIYSEVNQNKAKIIFDGLENEVSETGNFIAPLIVEIPNSEKFNKLLSGYQEHFAPVIHISEFQSLEQAVDLVNLSEYALTAGIFSQSQDEVDYLSQKISAGNIYVNRPNTGARVGIEPFGGYKLSGTGPKAGSTSYLHFMQRTIQSKLNLPVGRAFSNEAVDFFDWPSFTRKKKLTETQKEYLNIDSLNIIDEFSNYFDCRKDNVIIPGQISETYFKNAASKKNLVITNQDLSNSFSSVLNSLLSISGQSSVILCSGQKSYERNAQFFHLVSNVEVVLASEKCVNDSLAASEFHNLFFDLDLDSSLEMIKKLENLTYDDNLIKILTPYFGAKIDPLVWLEIFCRVKSYAVNTLRHGAPLNIN
jgi:RHH-type proline utilization regulon transcriptional repressor/proline dehydrogenase/delta 1-pyrroline-5-carboxylate dehydrogenase